MAKSKPVKEARPKITVERMIKLRGDGLIRNSELINFLLSEIKRLKRELK